MWAPKEDKLTDMSWWLSQNRFHLSQCRHRDLFTNPPSLVNHGYVLKSEYILSDSSRREPPPAPLQTVNLAPEFDPSVEKAKAKKELGNERFKYFLRWLRT